MKWFPKLFGRAEEKGMSSLDLFREIYGGRESSSGAVVNWQTALDVSTVLACARVIANGVAQVPFRVYQDQGKSKRIATDHPLNAIISRAPNPTQTAFGLRETMTMHCVLTGNAFAWVGRVGRERRVKMIEVIDPGRVTTKREESGALSYTVRADDGTAKTFGPDAIWHLRGPSWNAWLGMDATKLARNAIGLSMATEEAHARHHKHGAQVSGLLSMTNKIGPEKFVSLSAWLDRHSYGGDRQGKPVILDDGAKFTPFAMTGVDAQHIETRKLQIEEICRVFGVMPIMVGYSDKAATYASAEQMFLAHVVHTLAPWYERIEQSADMSLLSEEDRAVGFYTKFTPNGLMRGAAKDRAEYFTAALGTTQQPGWMTRNEVRALEEMDPVSGGDEFPALITQPANAAGDANAAP